jgi:hypothetical protein
MPTAIDRACGGGALLFALSCTGGQASPNAGLGEPLRIESGEFVAGKLPGSPQPDGSAPDAGADPQVTDVNVANTAIAQGELGLVLAGHATLDAQTVAVRFADLGTGYWVVPVGAPDPSDNGLLTWQASADFGRDLTPGFHDLVFAAIGADGASGTQSDLSVCIDTPVPDNLNICVPKRRPPAVVLSLNWDSPVDLDLIVLTPSGNVIGGKTASSVPPDAGVAPASKASGALDRDSNRACVIDGIDREDVVWQSTPEAGDYQVWADLFAGCGKPAVRFTVSLWLAVTQPDGTQRLVQQEPPLANGLLTAGQANGGAGRGLFVGDFVLK